MNKVISLLILILVAVALVSSSITDSEKLDDMVMIFDTPHVTAKVGESLYGKTAILEKGNANYGWEHIKKGHVGDGLPRKTLWPKDMGEEKIQEWIQKTLKEGDLQPRDIDNIPNRVIDLSIVVDSKTQPVTKNIRVVYNEKTGTIISAFPRGGPTGK
jgi:hypothetical protein